ncbi:DUF4743 domain-containing protein [Roseomonas sp. OT10]|uniref:NUDIX hydrolase n=1 Tax=Roseomonas cutis TaxID=2897332 RepID=UPI001E393002|nr:DUF4743 domain-containing protein [Roseomonas sp. OT10]UFN50216.1 DUF4743 domain-containing protein [Roseomonas sp. OT10]
MESRADPRLLRHVAACNNAPSPHPPFGDRVALRLGGEAVGWLPPVLAEALPAAVPAFRRGPDGVALDPALDSVPARSAALDEAVGALAGQGGVRRRQEPFDVRATPDGPVLAWLDRGAVAPFGIPSQGAHLNGLVRRADGLHLWIGRRAKDKAVAPGKLDNMVAGGVPAGLTPWETLLKESEEEASLPAALAARARPAGEVSYVMVSPEGLRRDRLLVFDLELPEDFTPRPQDDEMEGFELWPAARVLEAVREGDSVKFNVNLVLIDLFLREGLVPDPDGALRAGLRRFA